MGSETTLTDAATYVCDEGSVLRVCEGLTEVVPVGFARKLESALKVAEEALRGIDHGFCSHRQTVREAQRRCREALRAIEKIKGGV